MSRKFTAVIASASMALAFLAAGGANADDKPVSVNESAPARAGHQTVPTAGQRASEARGGLRESAPVRELGFQSSDSRAYEVQTPSSVNESAPWLAGGAGTPTMRGR